MKNHLAVNPVTGRVAAKVYTFDSLATLADCARHTDASRYDYGGGGQWCDNTSYTAAIELAATAARGDRHSRVADCEEMFDKLSAQGLFVAKDRLRWRQDFHGQIANVNAYLAGDPMHWRRVTRPQTDKAPLRVAIDVTSSAGLSQHALALRGVVLTALVRALKMTRPTTLEVVTGLGSSGGGGCYTVVSLDPDDLTGCAWALGSSGYARALTYPLLQANGANGGWPYGVSPFGDVAKVAEITRQAIGLKEDDVFVPPCYLDDSKKIMSDPLDWLNTQLEHDSKVAGREHIPLETLTN